MKKNVIINENKIVKKVGYFNNIQSPELDISDYLTVNETESINLSEYQYIWDESQSPPTLIRDLHYTKNKKESEIKNNTDIILDQGMYFNDVTYDVGLNDKIIYLSLLVFKDGLEYPIRARVKEGITYFNSPEEVTMVVATMFGYVESVYNTEWDLLEQVFNATTIEEVESIEDTRLS